MKIAYNPTGGSALSKSQIDSLKNDIIFDLSGMAVYARGIPVGKVYLPFEKSTSSTTEGYNGLVPFPDYNGNSKTRFLREDGTWVVPTNTNNYRPISINGTPILENNNTALNLVAGTNITLSPKKDSNNKYTGEVTITANAIGIKDLSGTSFSTYLKSSITYGYNSDETKKDNIVGDFGIFNMQTSSYTESNHFYFRQFRGQARIDKLYTRLYYKRENEDIKYTDWKEILKLGDYTTLAGYGITDAVKLINNSADDVRNTSAGFAHISQGTKWGGGLWTVFSSDKTAGIQINANAWANKTLATRIYNNSTGTWYDWHEVAFKGTTLAEYGITDAVKWISEVNADSVYGASVGYNTDSTAPYKSGFINVGKGYGFLLQGRYDKQLIYRGFVPHTDSTSENPKNTFDEWKYILDENGGKLKGALTLQNSQYSGIKNSEENIILSAGNSVAFIGAVDDNTTIVGTSVRPTVLRTSENNLWHYRGDKSSNYLILDTANASSHVVDLTSTQTITGEKTFSKLKVSNTNLVANLNADMVGGKPLDKLFAERGQIPLNDDKAYDYNKALIAGGYNTISSLSTSRDIVNAPFDNYGTLLYVTGSGDTWMQLAAEYSRTSLYVRSGNIRNSEVYIANNWKEVAFTDTNSLTPSGGTLNVDGNLTATSFLGNLDGSYINKLTGYTKATTSSDITANDTLNAALGKLELKADTAYDLVKGAYDGDGTIENLAEILKVLEGISDTDTIKSLLGKYRRLDKDEFYGSGVHSKFWINRTIEGGGGWAYPPILVFKADKETKLLNIGVYGNNSDLIYSYIGSNDHNSTKNLRIYPDGTVTAPVFNGNLNYTNLTGSTTTANQAIVSNGTKDGWKLLTLGSGAFLDDYPMLNLGTLSDYVEYVLLLHPINGSTDWQLYYSYGTIYTHRSNGLSPCSSIIYNSISKYNSTDVYVSMVLQGSKYAQWCTCTYNRLKYCGLKLYTKTNHSSDLTIKGRWNSDPVLVKYKKNQRTDSNGNITSEEIIYNEEIANSIVVEGGDIIINSTYGKFNGTFVTSGGTALQFVKGDGSLDSNTYVSETEFPNLSSKGLYKNLTSSGDSNINKWKKFARINLSSDKVYTQCGGYMFIYDHEGHQVKGILDFHVRTMPDTSINTSNINLQSPYLKWHILDNSKYASNIKMVKVENGIFDLYITTSQTYTTFVILVFTPKSDKITLFNETWIDTLPENVICTSSYTITVPNATTATKLANTLTFSAGNFTSKTYNGSSAVTVNIPTHTSHLTNDSFVVHNPTVKNVTSLTRSTLGYAYCCGDTCGPNLDSFWHDAGPVAIFGVSSYLCAILASAGNNNVIKYKKVVNGSAQESWKTFVNSDGTQIGSSVRPVYVKNDGSVAPFILSNATANDTRNILVGHDNGIYLVTSAKINPSAGILIANGFVKSGSSSSYVLLGDGGHKAISDFLLKSEIANQELSANLTTITIKSLAVTTDWMDTGIIGSYKNKSNTLVSGDLETGTYIVQVYCSGAKSGGTSKFYNCYWSGVMSWYSGTNSTNSLGEDEILLHRSGHADNNCTIYLRTKLLSGSKGLKLLIAANQAMDGAEYTFKFKRVI